MNIKPIAGLTIVPLPDGKRAIVQVVIAGPKTAVKIAAALTSNPTPSSEQGTSS